MSVHLLVDWVRRNWYWLIGAAVLAAAGAVSGIGHRVSPVTLMGALATIACSTTTTIFVELPLGHLPVSSNAVWHSRLQVPALVATTCGGVVAVALMASGWSSEAPIFVIIFGILISWAHLGVLSIASRFNRGGELAVAFVGTLFLVLLMWIGGPAAFPARFSDIGPPATTRLVVLACLSLVALAHRPTGGMARARRDGGRSDTAVRIAHQRIPDAGPPPLRQWLRTSLVTGAALLTIATLGLLTWWLIFRHSQWPSFGAYLGALGLDVFHAGAMPPFNLPLLMFASLPAILAKDVLDAPRPLAIWPISAQQRGAYMVRVAVQHSVLVWAFLAAVARLTAGPLDDLRLYLIPALAAAFVGVDVARMLVPVAGPASGFAIVFVLQWGLPALLGAPPMARLAIGAVSAHCVLAGLWILPRLLRTERRLYQARSTQAKSSPT